jgi:hypothetical protein
MTALLLFLILAALIAVNIQLREFLLLFGEEGQIAKLTKRLHESTENLQSALDTQGITANQKDK